MAGLYENRPQLPCMICGNQLPEGNYGAVEFIATGNYGSSIWDSTGRHRLVGYVHDKCLQKYQDRLCCELAYTREESFRRQVSVARVLSPDFDPDAMVADEMLLAPPEDPT